MLILDKNKESFQLSLDYIACYKENFEVYCWFLKIQNAEHLITQPMMPIPA